MPDEEIDRVSGKNCGISVTTEKTKASLRSTLWSEYETRHDGLTRQSITIRLPFVEGLDSRVLKSHIHSLINRQTWPEHLIKLHQDRVTVVTAKQRSILDSLVNVNKICRPEKCCCAKVQRRLQSFGYKPLPMHEGHIFCIGREYDGPCARVMSRNNKNIDTGTE